MGAESVLWYTPGNNLKKKRLRYGSIFYRGTTEQDEQEEYPHRDGSHATAVPETGDKGPGP